MPEDPGVFAAIPLFPVPVHAGFPSPAGDYSEPLLDLNDLVVRHKYATFYIRVIGDSMRGACIHAGAVIAVDRALTASHNKVVVARVGQNLLLKRLRLQQRKMFLHSDPSEEPVIELRQGDDMEIWGIVTYCIQRVK